jgi:hypothetical protein
MRMSQSNAPGGLYPPWGQGAHQVHLALHGDPTLRLHPVKPPSGLSISASAGQVNLNWSPSPDDNIQGYHVYRGPSADEPFTRITQQPVSGTSFTDSPPSESSIYMVRAIKVEETPSGTYLNPSLGVFVPPNESANPLQLAWRSAGTNGPAITIMGNPGQRFRLESSDDLETWQAVAGGSLIDTVSELPVRPDQPRLYLRAVNLE